MPSETEIQAAIDELARAEQEDWLPRPSGSADGPTKRAAALVDEVGAAIVPRLLAALPAATGTGRIVLASLILKLDRARGEALIDELGSDATPAWVDTCLVGYRSVGAWARSCSARWASEQPIRPFRRRHGRKWLIRAVVALVLVGVWWWLRHC
jgi:hypothetical protein